MAQLTQRREQIITVASRLATNEEGDSEDTIQRKRAAYLADLGIVTADALEIAAEGVDVIGAAFIDNQGTKVELVPKQVRATLAAVRAISTSGSNIIHRATPADIFASTHQVVGALRTLSPEFDQTIPGGVDKSMLLLVELANARSSDQVARTLDAAAAPVGSWRIKHRRPSLTLNAFLGATWGRELLLNAPAQTNGHSLGLAAPVGLHGTVPLGGDFALGGLVTLLDLGAISALRVDSKTAEKGVSTVPNVGFAQVFSPGGFATVNWKMVALGVGVSGSPLLRKVEVSEDGSATPVFSEKSVLRVHGFLGIDVTLFHLL
jgi:hypothetical protein